jgi:hypothetical protein
MAEYQSDCGDIVVARNCAAEVSLHFDIAQLTDYNDRMWCV